MDKKQKAAEKATKTGNIITKLKEGSLETIPSVGLSPVWKKFLKIRDVKTEILVEYVQCCACKGLVPYASQSGTSNLLKHKCKTSKEQNFKELPADKIASVKRVLITNIIGSAALDFCPVELFCGSGYLQMAQGLISLGDKYGNIDVKAVLPNAISIYRRIEQMKEESRDSLLDVFKKSFEKGWCSFSFEISNTNGIINKPLLATLNIHYFEQDLSALRKKKIFAIGVDTEDEPTTILASIIRNFNVFGVLELHLHKTKIITQKTMLMKTIFQQPFRRYDCILYKIKYVLDAGFNSSTDTSDSFNEVITNCRNIIRYIKNSGKSSLLKLEVNVDCETWKSKINMVEAVECQYDEIIKLLDSDGEVNFVLNKKRLREIVAFVTPFLEAMDDLSATEYPTANKTVLWWALLNDHLQDTESYSFWMKDVIKKMKPIFDFELQPTMDNKIDCFLDPRFRWLKMFPHIEREETYDRVRNILQTPVENTAQNVTSGKALQSPPPPPKKSRFSKYESTETDVGKDDEVTMYLQAADVQSVDFHAEFNLIGIFWKLAAKKFPKLFQLATNRLHVPASCGNLDRNGYVERKYTIDKLNDLMIIGSSFNIEQ